MVGVQILHNNVTEILKKLVHVVSQEISTAWGIKDELNKLQGTLKMILVIADPKRRRVTEELGRVWLMRLKDVAYDAEDIIDEFAYEIMRERHSIKYKFGDFFTTSSPLAFDFKMAKKIKDINRRFVEISKDMAIFQLPVALGEGRERRISTSLASQFQYVGREDDKNKLIQILTTLTAPSPASLSNSDYHSEKVHVVSIVGMGGLGKTTLAQLVYSDDLVEKHFEQRIWVHVSEDFDVDRLLISIMESITGAKFTELSNFDVLVRQVRKQLTGKRYLLVLDDLWNEDAEQWERLQNSLIVGAQGSKILITTRRRQVADVVKGSISPYFLRKLQADECWSIMERKAFSPGGAQRTPGMINIGKEIANKCSGGLPLAAGFLGSLMHSKNTESNWLSIRETHIWSSFTNQMNIMPILKLSYDNLSPHLQQCFSYCSIFPKDWELSKQTLIQLWMAEGFLQLSKNMSKDCSFEDIGDEYFESLLWSSFFYRVEKNELDDVMTFKMHDLVHDLAQAVVGDHECSTVKVSDQLERNSEARRLNLIVDEKSSASAKTVSNTKKLRTIIVHEPNYTLNLSRFSRNKHLRILHFGRPAEDFSGIRCTASKFKQLRYFHVSSMILSNDLFDEYSYSGLYNLQTLVLSRCSLVQNHVSKMGSLKLLRHLDISYTDIRELPDSVTSLHNLQSLDLNHCKDFTTFPDSVTGLECLRYLDMSFTLIEKIPNFVTSLSNLQTLDVNTCIKLRVLPEYMASPKNLSIFNFKNCPLLEALPRDFGSLIQLRYLNLYGTAIKELPEACTNLSNLEYVHLFRCELPKEVTDWIQLRKFDYCGKGTPTGIGKLIWLKELRYEVREKVINGTDDCNVGIEELGNLNSLACLSIINLGNVEDPIDAERANLKAKKDLRRLRLSWDELEEEFAIKWDQKSCNFQVFEALRPPPCLSELIIENFTGRDLPWWMCVPASIEQLPRLKILDINGCKSLSEIPSFPSLEELVLQKIDLKLVWSVGYCLTSLRNIWLKNIDELVYFPIGILQNNCHLQVLRITECNQFQEFPVNDDENENLVALYGREVQKLEFVDCPVLKLLPDLRGWTTLKELTIFNCPQVEESLTYDLKSLSFLEKLYVDFIQRDQRPGDPSVYTDLINLLE